MLREFDVDVDQVFDAGADRVAHNVHVWDPAFSVWMPTPGTTGPDHGPPGLDYHRTARREFARLYKEYDLNPPEIPKGSHVSLCRDIYRHMDAILSGA